MVLSEITTKTLIDNPDGLFFYGTRSNQVIFVEIVRDRQTEENIPRWTIVDNVDSNYILKETSTFVLYQTSYDSTDESWQMTYFLIDDYIIDSVDNDIIINRRKSLIDAII